MKSEIGLIGVLLIVLVLAITLLSGCDEVQVIYGTISIDLDKVPSNIYVRLDDNTNPDDGYIKMVIIENSSPVLSVAYIMDTTDVAAGSYYLLGGWDYAKEDNLIDPETFAEWDAIAWYGGIDDDPPNSANVSSLNSQYDITLYELQ